MKTKSLMVLALIALFIGMGTSAYAVTITPIVSSDAAGTIPITAIAPGQRFFVNVQVSEASGIAGATATLLYDKTLFDVIGKDGAVAPLDATTSEINRGTYSGTNTDPANVVLESEAFGNMTDSGGTNTMTLRTGKVDTASGKVMLSGAFIDKTTGAAPASLTGTKNLFRIRFRVKSGVTTGTGTFTLTASKPTAGGWDGNTAVPALIGAAAQKINGVDNPNFSVFDYTKCPQCAFPAIASNLDTANATATLAVQGQAGNVRGLNQAPSMTDVMQLLYLYKHLRNTPGYETYTSDKYSGNLDFNHDGNVNMSDVMYLLYYYKHLRNTPGYENYTSAE